MDYKSTTKTRTGRNAAFNNASYLSSYGCAAGGYGNPFSVDVSFTMNIMK